MSFLAWKRFWSALETEEKVSESSEQITKDESILPVQLEAMLIKPEEQKIAVISVQDLLKKNRFRDLLEFTSSVAAMGSWEWDLVNDKLLLNDEVYRLLELSPQIEFNKENFKTLIASKLSKEDYQAFDQHMQEAVRKGIPFDIEVTYPVNNNFVNFNIQTHPVVLENQTIKIYGILQNVSKISKRTDDMYFMKYCLDYARDMIYWTNPDGSIFYANDTVTKTLGYTSEEFSKKKLSTILVNSDISLEKHWKLLKAEKSISFEAVQLSKDGKQIPVSIISNYINYRGKEFNCSFVRNLTSYRVREGVLKKAKATLDNAVDLIFWLNEDGGFEYFNKAFVDKMGYSPTEIRKMNILDFILNGNKERYIEGWKRLKKNKFHTNVYREMITKTGVVFSAEMTISMVQVGTENFSTTILRDVSQRNKLSELAELSRYSLDRSLDMIFWLNADGSFKYINETFIEKSGYSKEEIGQLSIFNLFPETNKELFEKDWEKLKKGNVLLGVEGNLRTKTGNFLPCEMNVSIIEIKAHEFSIYVLRDITARKSKERERKEHILEIERLNESAIAENIELKQEIDLEFNFGNIITRDPNYKKVLRQVEQVAETDATVLITGETGTGKELLARAIYRLSSRAEGSLVKVNCGALPENLIESELFGHEKGAFTGAYQQKIGKFERADRGTIFLDEIGELPLALQAKLLRVLQEGEIERVGGTTLLNIDVRIIAATNRNLEEAVAKGTFRADLYYRLNVFPIHNIPLRERREDIPVLVKYFVKKYSNKINKKISEISPSSMNKLMAYNFLGNIRELENLIERAVILSKGKILDFKFPINNQRVSGKRNIKFLDMEEMQKKHIIDALKRTNGKISGALGAAKLLNMNDKTLASRMRKLGIGKHDYLKKNVTIQ